MSKNPKDESLFAADLVEIIQHSRIFSEIDRAACEALLPRLERITLKQGEVLFEQGALSDCLYILVDGQLMAVLRTPDGKQKIVGVVEKGETVGELGALSNQPRSLTIRAAIDSRILKFPRSEFEEFSKNHPKVISRVIDLIINRSQNTIKLISEKRIYQHIAIIRGDRHAPLDKFIIKLKENFLEETSFILIEDPFHNKPLNELIEKAEQENKSVVFILDQYNVSHLRSKINHIGAIFVIVDGDIPGHLSDFALKMLSRNQTPFTIQYELVLLHDDHVEKPSHTSAWLQQADFTLHHHIKLSDPFAYKRLLRFMMGKAIGVVLGGGGGKGWVGLGTLKILEERGIPIDSIGGTSAGAAIAACYANTLSYAETERIYKTLVESASHPFSIQNLTWPIISIVSSKVATHMAQKIFQDIQIEDLWIPYFAISSNLSTGKEIIHKTGTLWESIRASAAIPGVVPPMVINGELHYDGGLLNNLPVDQMRHMIGTESIIIAVSLTGMGDNQKVVRYNFPPVVTFRMGLLKKLHLGYKDYRFPPYFNTFLQALLLGASAKEKANELKADILIAPDLSRYRLFDISVKRIEILTKIGYEATQKQLDENTILDHHKKDKKT